MTRILLFVSVCCSLFISSNALAARIIAINNGGDWAESSSWNLNRIPATEDQVLIPEGITITVTSNNYNSVPSRPLLNIEVRGTLLFNGGSGQLNLDCASMVFTKGNGIIPSTGCNCNQIAIGLGEAVWKGAYPSVTNEASVVGDCNSTLPINILSFTAFAEEQEVELTWNTADAVGFSHFEVQRSADAVHYTTLATLASAGNHYQFSDSQPLNGAAYYRLKAVDADGSYTYSAVASARYESVFSFDVYPNPAANGSVTLVLSEGENTVVLKDLLGSQIAVNVQAKEDFTYTLEYPANLPAGVYILTVFQSKGQYSKTLVIQ